MSDRIVRLNTALESRYRIESELGEGGMATQDDGALDGVTPAGGITVVLNWFERLRPTGAQLERSTSRDSLRCCAPRGQRCDGRSADRIDEPAPAASRCSGPQVDQPPQPSSQADKPRGH
jgi:hypothetical protein